MKTPIFLTLFAVAVVTAVILFFVPPNNKKLEPLATIDSLLINPSRLDGGWYLYREGAEVILHTRNAVKKEILFVPKGTDTAGLTRTLFTHNDMDDESRFTIDQKDLLGELWARAYNVKGEFVESARLSLGYDAQEQPSAAEIEVTLPRSGDVVVSPQKIIGKARGFWFFEASMPVTLFDANNKVLAKVPLHAIDDWMTTEFVQFEGDIQFIKPSVPTGFLLFENDNPSGLVELSKTFRVPVKFTE